jgi:hypothetical protein
MLGGMLAGTALLTWAWWYGAYAWTWYALTGAGTTFIVALLLSLVQRPEPNARPI